MRRSFALLRALTLLLALLAVSISGSAATPPGASGTPTRIPGTPAGTARATATGTGTASPTAPSASTPPGTRGAPPPVGPVAPTATTTATAPASRPGTAKPAGATATASRTGTAKPAGASTPNVVTTPNTAIGAQRYQTFVRQQLTDRQDLAVNVANGNLVLHGRDLEIKGTGLPLVIERFYNNQSANTSASLGNRTTLGTSADVGLKVQSDGSVLYQGPSGYIVSFAPNGGGYTTPTGLDATLVKNSDGSFTLTFHASGEQYSFNAGGALTTDTDRNGNALRFADNPDGSPATITDTQGRQVTFATSGHNGVTFVDSFQDPPNGNGTWGYQYDGNNNLSKVLDAAGEVTVFAYSGQDLTQITDPNGHNIFITYDAQHRATAITRVTDPTAGTGPTIGFAYNSGSTVVTDANNHQTTYTYDAMGRVTQVVDAAGHSQAATYNPDSNVLTYTDAASKVTNYTYGANGGESMTQMQLPTGATAKLAYADSAHPYSATSFTDAQGNTAQYTYDPNGNQTSSTNQLASNNTLKQTYNANGTVATSTDALGHVTTYGYDTAGNLTTITPPAPLGAITLTDDVLSRVATVTDGRGQQTSFLYDRSDRPIHANFSDGTGIAYGYDANGNLTTLIDGTGTTNLTYDPLNRQLTKVLPGSGGTLTYTYDGVGNLTSFQDAGGTVTYGYNSVNLLTALTDPNNQQTTFGYDTNNHRTRTTNPNGVTMTEAYDGSQRLTGITGAKGGTTLTGFSYTYTKPGTSTDTGVRQTMVTGGATTTYTYDAVNRLLGAVNPTQNNQYTYDGAGNRLTATLNGTSAFAAPTYNAANELTSLGSTTFGYDASGNETGRSTGLTAFAYNVPNQTTSITANGTALAMTYTGITQNGVVWRKGKYCTLRASRLSVRWNVQR